MMKNARIALSLVLLLCAARLWAADAVARPGAKTASAPAKTEVQAKSDAEPAAPAAAPAEKNQPAASGSAQPAAAPARASEPAAAQTAEEKAPAVAAPAAQAAQPAAKSGTAARPEPSSGEAKAAGPAKEAKPEVTTASLELRLKAILDSTGTAGSPAPLAVRAKEKIVAAREAQQLDPTNRLLPSLLRVAELMVDAAEAEAKNIVLRAKQDSLRDALFDVKERIQTAQNGIIQTEQGRAASLMNNLAEKNRQMEMEKRRNSELQRLADEERARGDQYAEEAMKERARGDQLAEEALKERERGDQLAQQALSEKQRADEAARVADSLRAEALRHQEEARKQLDKLQSKLIQVTKDARGIILSMSDILFETNKADLTQDLQNNLAKIAGILTVYSESRITVEGHTDNKGTAEYNQGLSERRAENVRAFLVKSGIDEGRLSAVGYGMTRPVADNSTAEGRQKNRRVDLVIADPALDAK